MNVLWDETAGPSGIQQPVRRPVRQCVQDKGDDGVNMEDEEEEVDEVEAPSLPGSNKLSR